MRMRPEQTAIHPVDIVARLKAESGPAKPKKKSGRWQQINTFHRDIKRHLSLAEQAVVWHLIVEANQAGIVDMADSYIAKGCGITDRSVRRARERLESIGLIVILAPGRTTNYTTKYQINYKWLPAAPQDN